MSKAELLRAAVGPKGEVYSLETNGRVLRHAKKKSEVVYQAKERLHSISVSSSGALHAIGSRYHTNASGSWMTEKLPFPSLATGISIWAPSDDLVWAGSMEGHVASFDGDAWSKHVTKLPTKDNFIYAIHGVKSDVYVASDKGVAHFDGKKWQVVKMPGDCLFLDVLARPNEPCIIVGRDGPNLFTGKGAKWKAALGISDDELEDFTAVASRKKELFIATGSRLIAWDGKKARTALANASHVASNDDVVAAIAHDGVHVLTGKTWTFYPAAAAKPSPKKKPAG